jgi:hypothetical protein
MQAPDLENCIKLFDLCIPIIPIMSAMTASTPFFRDLLAENDNRLPIFQQVKNFKRKSDNQRF